MISRLQTTAACLLLLVGLTWVVPLGAAPTRFLVITDLYVDCVGCDPLSVATAQHFAQLTSLNAQHVHLSWLHTGLIYKDCGTGGLVQDQISKLVDNGPSPNTVGDNNTMGHTANGLGNWAYTGASVAQIGGTGGAPWLFFATTTSCLAADCGSGIPGE